MSQQGYKFCKNIICMGLRRRAENKWQVFVSLHVFRSVLFPQIGWKFRGKLYKYFPRCACKKRKLYFFFLYIFLLITSSFPTFLGTFFFNLGIRGICMYLAKNCQPISYIKLLYTMGQKSRLIGHTRIFNKQDTGCQAFLHILTTALVKKKKSRTSDSLYI